MRKILILLLLSGPALYAQKLDAWLTHEAEDDPQAYIQKAAKKIPATPAEAAGNFFVLGRCYANLNREDLALKYYLLSKTAFERLGLEEPAKDLAFEIHKVISSQENYEKYGNTFLKEYYNYAKKTGSKERLAYVNNEFAKNAYALFDFKNRSNMAVLDSANTIFLKALNYANQTEDIAIKEKLYSNLGALESTKKNFSEARKYYDLALAYSLESGNKYDLFKGYFNYGNNYFIEKNYPEAITWFKKAEQIGIPKFRDKSTGYFTKK